MIRATAARLAFLSFAGALLGGCVTLYDVPSGPNQPTIAFRGNYSLLMVYKDGQTCSGGQAVPKAYSPFEPGAKPLPLRADELTSFQVRHFGIASAGPGLASVTCGGLFSFVPKRGKAYLLDFQLQAGGCNVRLREGIPGASEPTFERIEVIPRKEKFAMTPQGSACQAIE